ncbi:MAG: hypothetical protein NTY15_15010 [Planctomycetota bacterium]|nr:hypothetical protein [Planctomycetota bacterium]
MAGLRLAFAFAAGALVMGAFTATLDLGEAATAVFFRETAGFAAFLLVAIAAGLAFESNFLDAALGLPLIGFVTLACGFPPFSTFAFVFLTGILAAVFFFFEAFTGSS